ncbi:hypothetical protein PCANC_27041 [Puccinia coronata f. sp. avenae]|uniref:Helicase C-terminal domain-containing protein n=1 Tax=Puccinia coronata f. sp. avenae TaxID=200324 RepID=A0A2N5T9E6_9BASI|nr:hypothetical protein PCANC_27041 [Puccinia coronata f. sp. avenae]
MALGLGQNLKRVRLVIHMGRGDPSCIIQMIGRCGCDGNTGLAFILMEPNRKNGKNTLADFQGPPSQDPDTNMDALAITPRLHSSIGYIPLLQEDPNYIASNKRQKAKGFPACLCSNCAPEEAEALVTLAPQMTVDNMDDILASPLTTPKDTSIVTMIRKRKGKKTKLSCSLPPDVAEILANHLVKDFEAFFAKTLGTADEFLPSDFFSITEAKAVVAALDQIHMVTPHNLKLLESVIGGTWLPGQVEAINQSISDWMESNYFSGFLLSCMEHKEFIESEALRLRTAMEDAAYKCKLITQANARAKQDLADMERKEKAEQKAAEAEKEGARLHVAEMKKKQAYKTAAAKALAREEAAHLRKAKEEEAAVAKLEERESRARGEVEERAAKEKTKVEDKARRTEDKEQAKRKASINRDNRKLRKLKRTASLRDTAAILALHNSTPQSVDVSSVSVNLESSINLLLLNDLSNTSIGPCN